MSSNEEAYMLMFSLPHEKAVLATPYDIFSTILSHNNVEPRKTSTMPT
jgi:hypothetical protein